MSFESIFVFLREIFSCHMIIKLMIVAIVMDCLFGTLRAIKIKKPNSAIGIDGVIRKASMMVSIAFFVLIDWMLNINMMDVLVDMLVRIKPESEKIFAYIPMENAGLTEFFGLLFLAYETLSVLKNMYMCNLPVKKVWLWVDKMLHNYTDELPSTELTQEEAIKTIARDISTINKRLEERDS